MPRRLALTAAWLLLLALFFRWWEVTERIAPLALWSCLFLLCFTATLVAVRGPEGLLDKAERGRRIAWAALIVVAAALNLLIPQVTIAGNRVGTVVFVKVLDTVVPLWIVARALIITWTGRARYYTLAFLPLVVLLGLWLFVVRMPGRAWNGPLPALTPAESLVAGQIEHDVRRLIPPQGERNHRFPARLETAEQFLDSAFRASGYDVATMTYRVGQQRFANLEVTIPGTSKDRDIVIIGAHYDAAEGAPGADDNASGTAVLLALARSLAGRRFARTLRFVAFTNEEPPYFNGEGMGSRVYAALAAARDDRVVAMLSLETVGYYSEDRGSQHYPPPFSLLYPDRGDFIGFVGNMDSRPLVRRALATFRDAVNFPSQGVAAPAIVPGVGWSDHASFWRHGWQAIMITDTAPFRNPHYHLGSDTPDKLDYRRMARVATGLEAVVADLAGPPG